MVAAGEASGTLEAVLERLADFMEGQARLKGKVTAALAYPILMLDHRHRPDDRADGRRRAEGDEHLRELEHALPWYTPLLIFVSSIVAGYWWLLILVSVGTVVGFRRWRATPEGRLRWDSFPAARADLRPPAA